MLTLNMPGFVRTCFNAESTFAGTDDNGNAYLNIFKYKFKTVVVWDFFSPPGLPLFYY